MSAKIPVILVDHQDSFTYNIYQYFLELGADITIVQSHEISADDALFKKTKGIVLSPGPGSPLEAKNTLDIVDRYHKSLPILGVCLGHQIIACYFGGRTVKAKRIMHGKTSDIHNDQKGVFEGLPSKLRVARYHSLIVEEKSFPDVLEISAFTKMPGSGREIMGLRHKQYAIEGVQFHPEAIQCEHGKHMFQNFLTRCE